jgi:uncharacterized protein (DUF1810 family)
MTKGSGAVDRGDPYDLNRFISAQEGIYDRVLAELRGGQKRTHWMWYIFPQIDGLGHSPTTRHYAIKSLEEARVLSHPALGRGSLKELGQVFLHWPICCDEGTSLCQVSIMPRIL